MLIALLLVVVVAFLPRGASSPPVRLPALTYHKGKAKAVAGGGSGASATARNRGRRAAPGSGRENRPSARAVARRHIKGTLIFVVDDVGNDLAELKPFLRFPGPLTLSIMPQRPYTRKAYRMIRDAGKTPMLHQPMEPDNHDNPGAGAIYTTMDRPTIDALLARNLAEMPDVRWVNNHMGSRATSDAATMRDVLGYLKARGMHFLDSRTTRSTKVPQVARSLGLPYYHRNSLFLDDTVSTKHIEKEIDSGLTVASREGYAVMIGHVWDRDLAALLIRLYPRLVAEGYRFASIDSLPQEVQTSVSSRN